MKEQFDSLLKACPVIAILRGVTPDTALPVCKTLFDAGISLLEIPLNSPDALESIRRVAAALPSGKMVGAGTVLTPEDVRSVKDAGGQFIISPNTDPDVIRETVKQGLISIPGFFTATEAFTAMAAGADYLKLFPAGGMGPSYIKDLKAVVKKPILAVGGVNADNLADFLKVASGAGIGGGLYKPGKTLEQLKADALALLRIADKSL